MLLVTADTMNTYLVLEVVEAGVDNILVRMSFGWLGTATQFLRRVPAGRAD